MKKATNIINGLEILSGLDQFKVLLHSLMDVIARTSVWTPKEYIKQSPVYPDVKRGRSKDKGLVIDNIRIDDNTYANRALKAAISKNIKFENYETCHIWPGTTYDERYHTLLQNLVLIPRSLAGLSDHQKEIIDMLKYRAWELYKWHPEGTKVPNKPDYYPTEWGTALPPLTEISPVENENVLLEDLFTEIDYEDDREAEEIEKVKRRVKLWIKNPEQYNSIILTEYMKLSKNGNIPIKRDMLKDCIKKCTSMDFMGNYNQMKNFGIKNHGKVFDEAKDGTITLWEPTANYIKQIFGK